MNLQNSVKFTRPIGIELTFVPTVFDKGLDDSVYHDGWEHLTLDYKRAAEAEGIKNAYRIYNDPGCVEFPSPILKSWAESEAWFEQATDIGKMIGVSPTHPQQESGMGHIHVGCRRHHIAQRVTLESLFRPYLGWVFAAPISHKFCRSFLSVVYEHGLQSHLTAPSELNDRYFATETIPRYLAFNPRRHLGTVEMRMFDSAENWKQQREHIAFAQRFYSLATNNRSQRTPQNYFPQWSRTDYYGQREILRKEVLSWQDFDRCVKDFKELLALMELPWDTYAKYVERNLVPAFEYGERI